MKKIIIYDMDGTLIDSVGIWNAVDVDLITELGGPQMSEEQVQKDRDDRLREYSQDPAPYIRYCIWLGERYGSSLDGDAIHTLRYQIAQRYLEEKIDYKPDAEKMLVWLKERGYTLVIASTTKRSNMDVYRTKNRRIMEKAPLEQYFTAIYTRDDVSKMKPHPEVYERVLQDFNVAAEEAVVFEDSLVGVEAARAAGIETAVIYDRYSDHDRQQLEEMADWYFRDYGEVLSWLEKKF